MTLFCFAVCQHLSWINALAPGSYLSGLFLQVSDLVSNNCQFVAGVRFDEVVSLKTQVGMSCYRAAAAAAEYNLKV